MTTQIQRRIYGHATDVEIRPLNEEKAVQAAVDLIGELFIFAVLPFSQTSLVFIQSTLLLMLKVSLYVPQRIKR